MLLLRVGGLGCESARADHGSEHDSAKPPGGALWGVVHGGTSLSFRSPPAGRHPRGQLSPFQVDPPCGRRATRMGDDVPRSITWDAITAACRTRARPRDDRWPRSRSSGNCRRDGLAPDSARPSPHFTVPCTRHHSNRCWSHDAAGAFVGVAEDVDSRRIRRRFGRPRGIATSVGTARRGPPSDHRRGFPPSRGSPADRRRRR